MSAALCGRGGVVHRAARVLRQAVADGDAPDVLAAVRVRPCDPLSSLSSSSSRLCRFHRPRHRALHVAAPLLGLKKKVLNEDTAPQQLPVSRAPPASGRARAPTSSSSPPSFFPPSRAVDGRRSRPPPMEERGDALHIADTRKLDDRPEDPLWDWHMGVIIERMPRIMNPPPAWELEYHAWEEARERRRAVAFPAELRPACMDGAGDSPPLVATQTEDDAAGRLQSLDRSLNRSLYLLVQRRDPRTGVARWTFPSVAYTALPYATLPPRDAAVSAIRALLGDKFDVHTLGNAPIAYHRYEYDAAATDGGQRKGAKLFLFHGLYCDGVVDLSASSDCVDHAWLLREQLLERLQPDEHLHALLLDVLLEDADTVEGVELQELHRRKERNLRFWEPPRAPIHAQARRQQQQQQQHERAPSAERAQPMEQRQAAPDKTKENAIARASA